MLIKAITYDEYHVTIIKYIYINLHKFIDILLIFVHFV